MLQANLLATSSGLAFSLTCGKNFEGAGCDMEDEGSAPYSLLEVTETTVVAEKHGIIMGKSHRKSRAETAAEGGHQFNLPQKAIIKWQPSDKDTNHSYKAAKPNTEIHPSWNLRSRSKKFL